MKNVHFDEKIFILKLSLRDAMMDDAIITIMKMKGFQGKTIENQEKLVIQNELNSYLWGLHSHVQAPQTLLDYVYMEIYINAFMGEARGT